MRTPLPEPEPRVLVAQLQSDHKELVEYMNRMLVRAKKQPIPGGYSIMESEVEAMAEAVKQSRDAVRSHEMAWRSCVATQTAKAVEQIETALRQGRHPGYPVLGAGQRAPEVESEFDLISLHVPAGSSDRYVIHHHEQSFGSEVGSLRTALQGQAELFDVTLRQLFEPR
ncbi:MAG: hypothetical protein KAI24_02205 [Planctomycetes bacterium]|nr:hypothetical protein [Planctomycetota bacterium]